ncbi:MAG TPA: DUF4381 domain-containing protein [Xanthomonadales bacterium]|nr:DUF4381 domain-containing protein [Xanthomonadales bacterium]
MNAQPLPLRDIHLPPEPSWWPPAPGWWVLAIVALALLAFATRRLVRWLRARRRRAALLAAFDVVAALEDPLARVTAVSELLRRAARLRDASAAALTGDDWLRFLDGDDPRRAFTTGAGRGLVEAPFRNALAAHEADAIVAVARPRYVELVASR